MAAPQQTIGHYRVVSKLGGGGMGEARATDTRLNREVAVKMLSAVFASDPMRMGRFAREAQVLASLMASSPGLPRGRRWRESIARGKTPLDEARPIALQIAEALESAHEKGVIHR